MKKNILYYIPIVMFMTILGCNKRSDQVVVIEKTKSYHMDECARVKMANTRSMTIAEAQALNYSPCKDCQPGRAPAGNPDKQQ